MLCEDADELEKRMEMLIAERDRLADESGIRADIFEEGAITLRQSAAKATAEVKQADPAFQVMIEKLRLKKQIFTLVLEEAEDKERVIGQMKAQAMLENQPGKAQDIETYYQEALSLNGYFFEGITGKIEEIDKQIASLKEELPKTVTTVTRDLGYKRLETLSFDMQRLIGIARMEVKELKKDNPKLAKRLKKVPLRELSDRASLGSRATRLYLKQRDLEMQLVGVRRTLEELQGVKITSS